MRNRKDLKKPGDGDFFRGIAEHLQLVWRLWKDPRVSPFLKILPLGSLVYLLSPLDIIIPLIDDIGVMWFFSYLFIELSPQDIVAEHRQELRNTIHATWKDKGNDPDISEEDIQDAEFKEKIE